MKVSWRETHKIAREITCPYCDHKWEDSYEVIQDEEEPIILDCPTCNKKFEARKVVTVDYRTGRDCSLNGEQHDFEGAIFNDNYLTCKKCGVTGDKEAA